ncbi:MAG: ABC transporter ATP-binding protein, partial [Clostridia bacterium]|nr:ABC transporter ATP-binding protein [Clostridia bacterium]
MKKYFKYIKPYRLYFILGPLLMLTEVAGEIVLPKLVGGMIDNGANGLAGQGFIVRQALMMLGCICLMITGGISGHYFAIKASVNFSSDLRKAVFDKVQGFSFRDIDSFSAGSLITRLTNDITQIMNITRMGLIMAVRSPGMLIGGIIMAFSINKSLASVLLVLLPVLAFAIFFIMRMAMPRFARMQKGIDNLNSTTQENISNVRVIKSFVRQDREKEKFSDANGELCDATLGALKVMVCTMPVMTLCMNIATLATLWRGGNVVIAGGLEVGSLNAIIQYITQILSSLMMVSMMIINSSRAITSFKRVGEVLDTVPDLSDADAQHPEKTVTDGKVEFKNVSFRYHTSNKEDVLSDVSFVAEAGKTLGIVGVTGSGKSSLVQLIPRLYDVTSG